MHSLVSFSNNIFTLLTFPFTFLCSFILNDLLEFKVFRNRYLTGPSKSHIHHLRRWCKVFRTGINFGSKQAVFCLKIYILSHFALFFLTVQSSSKRLVVGPLVRWFVCWLVHWLDREVCEKVTFRV